MSADTLLDQTRRYYESRLRDHGPSPRGVDWNSSESQQVRFQQLAKALDGDLSASVLDYGCGYGALALYLRQHGHRGVYCGFDISADMIDAARQVTAAVDECDFAVSRDALRPADVVLASGVFNVKQDASETDWEIHVRRTIDDLRALSLRAFAFNALTVFSDPEKRRQDLYYADPLALFEYCRRSFSRNVALLHDYGLYEFTMIVRLDA